MLCYLSNDLALTWKTRTPRIFNRFGTGGLKTRTFLKTCPDTQTEAKKVDVSRKTRTYGNPSLGLVLGLV